MATQKLDPSFLAAPYYGGSSYDPIQAVQAVKATNYKNAVTQQKDQQADMEKGLKELTIDIKGWSDDQGYNEISTELEDIRSKYVELGNKGMNLSRPNSMAEQKVSRAFYTALGNLKQKHDVWQEEKGRVENALKAIDAEKDKPEEEQSIDAQATLQAVTDWKDTKGGVIERAKKVNDLIVTKARPVDVGKYFIDTIPKLVPGTDKWVKSWQYDEGTGKFIKETVEGVDPNRAKAGILKAYNTAKPNIKNAVDKMYNADPEKGVLSKEDWIVKTYGPEYGQKSDKSAGGGAGGGLSIGYGLPEKDANGMYPVQPQIRDIYFGSKSGSGEMMPYESVGRVPTGAVFGFKPISIMGSINNTNTETGDKEGVGKAIPAVPVELNMLPVATKEMEITIPDPKDNTKTVTETFKIGDRIPKHVLDAMRIENAKKRENGEAPLYLTEYRPYMTMGLNYKQVKEGEKASGGLTQYNFYADQTGRTQSYTTTSIVPYDEVKKDLFAGAKENKQDWKAYDDYIIQLSNQLNGSQKMNSIFENKAAKVDDVYKALEQ